MQLYSLFVALLVVRDIVDIPKWDQIESHFTLLHSSSCFIIAQRFLVYFKTIPLNQNKFCRLILFTVYSAFHKYNALKQYRAHCLQFIMNSLFTYLILEKRLDIFLFNEWW